MELALGDGNKSPTYSERKNMAVARKSLVAASSIRSGEHFSPENLTVKRPGTGISPIHYWDLLGRAALHDYDAEELLRE